MMVGEFGPGEVMAVLATVAGTVAILRGPIGQALARRLEGRTGRDQAPELEVHDLRERIVDTDDLRARVAELEERLDFAERLLAGQQPRSLLEDRRP